MPNRWRLNLDNVNHSKPVPSDTPLPAGATLQEICIQDYYVALVPGSNLVYHARTIATMLESLLAGNTLRILDDGLRNWFIKSGLGRSLYAGETAVILDDKSAVHAVIDILKHPENYD